MIETIKTLIENDIHPQHIEVTGDGSHFQLIVVSDIFETMRAVKKQQKIYSIINHLIADGSLHAISIKTYTNNEWQKAQKFL